jgi:multicomponent Na+:H+ antiporter subunit E
VSRYIITFAVLMIFWYILSGYLEPFYIGAGIICCAVVALISTDLLFLSDETGILRSLGTFIRFIAYIPRLILDIVLANIDVAYRVLHPRMPIDPGFITLDTPFQNDILRTAFANAITLTPGTVTVEVAGGRYTVHALVREAAEESLLKERGMQNSLAHVFGEGEE